VSYDLLILKKTVVSMPNWCLDQKGVADQWGCGAVIVRINWRVVQRWFDGMLWGWMEIFVML